jgi:hypothetical protein
MAIDFNSKYAKKVRLDGIEYNIFDIKKLLQIMVSL